MQGRTEKLKRGGKIDKKKCFCNILKKMSQKGVVKDCRPPPLLCTPLQIYMFFFSMKTCHQHLTVLWGNALSVCVLSHLGGDFSLLSNNTEESMVFVESTSSI